MATTRDAVEKRIRTLTNDLDPAKHAIKHRRMVQLIEDVNAEIQEELPYPLTVNAGAISLTSGASEVVFKPSGIGISGVAAVILDSIHKPLVPTTWEVIQSLRVGTAPAKATYPWRYALRENDVDQQLYITVWPDYTGPGDTLTTVIAPSGTLLPLGTTSCPVSIMAQKALVYRAACECVGMMSEEQRKARSLDPAVLLAPQNPRSWVTLGEKALELEGVRLWQFDAQGEVTQQGIT